MSSLRRKRERVGAFWMGEMRTFQKNWGGGLVRKEGSNNTKYNLYHKGSNVKTPALIFAKISFSFPVSESKGFDPVLTTRI